VAGTVRKKYFRSVPFWHRTNSTTVQIERLMNDEPALPCCVSKTHRALQERLAHRPGLLARLHHLLDTLDQSVADGSDAHAAEERVIQAVRQLGQELLGRWAHEAAAQAQAQVRSQHPHASQHGKKKS
jgi:hypothetical protein